MLHMLFNRHLFPGAYLFFTDLFYRLSGNDDNTFALWLFGLIMRQSLFKSSLEGAFKLLGKFSADGDLPVSQCPYRSSKVATR